MYREQLDALIKASEDLQNRDITGNQFCDALNHFTDHATNAELYALAKLIFVGEP